LVFSIKQKNYWQGLQPLLKFFSILPKLSNNTNNYFLPSYLVFITTFMQLNTKFAITLCFTIIVLNTKSNENFFQIQTAAALPFGIELYSTPSNGTSRLT
jgi:hypothetical protein